MCKHCKNKKKIKQLEAEVADLKAKVESHMLHPYPYPYNFYTYPCYTALSSGTYSYPLGTAVTSSWVTYNAGSG